MTYKLTGEELDELRREAEHNRLDPGDDTCWLRLLDEHAVLGQRAERAEAEIVKYERRQKEMVEDYRLQADDHRVSRQSAINGLIHMLRAKLAAVKKERDALAEGLRIAVEELHYIESHCACNSDLDTCTACKDARKALARIEKT